jgi:hypothetical protein
MLLIMPASLDCPDDLSLQLALILRNGGSAAERFAWAWKRRPPELGSRATFAKRIGIHPTALSLSNFKLPAEVVTETERLLGVPCGFLAVTTPSATALPKSWRQLHSHIAVIRKACQAQLAHLKPQSPAWSAGEAVLRSDPETVLAELPATAMPNTLAREILTALRTQAAAALHQEVTITTTRSEITQAIEAMVETALTRDAGALRGARLRQARKWHRLLRQLEEP